MNSLRVLSVVGARPNFLKLAPLDRALARHERIEHIVVHTGQHYDREMSDDLFDAVDMAPPPLNLAVGSGSHASQTAAVMQRLEPILLDLKPDLVLVYGDVNSAMAGALVAAKMGVRVGHVEAGLRSRDWTMPEEINRVLTDRLSDLLFAPSRDAVDNLLAEGMAADRVHFVGNVMIDSLVHALPRARALNASARYGLEPRRFAVVTLHRPSNVDDPERLQSLLDTLDVLAQECPVVFPVHPRTRQRMNGLRSSSPAVRILPPLGYLEMLSLVASAGLVLTDSGGLQEETSFLGVPCVTVRPNTERPVTIFQGTNRLVPPASQSILDAVGDAPERRREGGAQIEYWDGKAAQRIAGVLLELDGETNLHDDPRPSEVAGFSYSDLFAAPS